MATTVLAIVILILALCLAAVCVLALLAVGVAGVAGLAALADDDDGFEEADFDDFRMQRKWAWELRMSEEDEERFLEALESHCYAVEHVSVNKADGMVRVGDVTVRIDNLVDGFLAAGTSADVGAIVEGLELAGRAVRNDAEWLQNTPFAPIGGLDVMEDLRRAIEARQAACAGEIAAALLDEVQSDPTRAGRLRDAIADGNVQDVLEELAAEVSSTPPASLSLTDENDGTVQLVVPVDHAETFQTLLEQEAYEEATAFIDQHQNVVHFALGPALPLARPGRDGRDTLRTSLGSLLREGMCVWKRDPTPTELQAVRRLLAA